jgi:hypothetical protein
MFVEHQSTSGTNIEWRHIVHKRNIAQFNAESNYYFDGSLTKKRKVNILFLHTFSLRKRE